MYKHVDLDIHEKGELMKKEFYNFKNMAYFVGFGFLTYTATSNIIQSSSRFKLNSLGKETELVLGIRENSPRLRKELQLSKRIINLIKSIENDYCKIQTINLYLLNSKMIGDDINSIKKQKKRFLF